MSPILEPEMESLQKTNDGRPPKRKRMITEMRREQNRQAQKNYRKCGVSQVIYLYQFNDCLYPGEKQKRRLQELASVEAQSETSQTTGIRQSVLKPPTSSHNAIGTVSKGGSGGHNGELCIDGRVTTSATDSFTDPEILPHEPEGPSDLGGPFSQVDPLPLSLQSYLNADDADIHWPQGYSESFPIEISMMPKMPPFQNSSIDSRDLSSESSSQGSPQWSSTSSHISSLSSDEPSPDNINQIIAENRISMEDIIFAGLESITQKFKKSSASTSPQSGPFKNRRSITAQQLQKSTVSTSYAPSPSITHLPLRQMALMSACLGNAAHIGIDIYEHIRQPSGHCNGNHTISPFFQPGLADTTLTPTTIASLYQSTIPDLRPCAAQIKQSHFLYIDTFPLPEFRKRILALRSCVTDCEDGEEGGEKVFDEGEFCRDIDADGIVCWGSDAKVGTGAPWDRRSWEVRPWFLVRTGSKTFSI